MKKKVEEIREAVADFIFCWRESRAFARGTMKWAFKVETEKAAYFIPFTGSWSDAYRELSKIKIGSPWGDETVTGVSIARVTRKRGNEFTEIIG